MQKSMSKRAIQATKDTVVAGARASLELFKVMIPVIIAIKVLQAFELIELIARPLGPAMKLVGLPPEMGLVWASALFNNIYTAIIVFLPLNAEAPVTAAQATVLGVMILIAHGLPIELSIARKSGPRLIFQAVSRVGSALLLGWILHKTYGGLDTLQGPAVVLLAPQNGADPSLAAWAMGEVKNLFSIFLIVTTLMGMMKLLDAVGVIGVMNRLLQPLLKLIGIGPRASAITVIGLGLGISYGGGLIINDARSGKIDRRDIFYSLTLMGLTHSIIEDTLLLLTLGGHISGLLWARLGYTLIFVALLVAVASRLPTWFCNAYLWGKPKKRS